MTDVDFNSLFKAPDMVKLICKGFPRLFYFAEKDCSRSGKIGMEVGSLREKIITSLFIYKYGEKNVDIDIPITSPEIDVRLFNKPISIKTKTGSSFNGVKLTWTVDPTKSKQFFSEYHPTCDMIFVQVVWNKTGIFSYIPLEVQKKVIESKSRENYIKLPKQGTNPRGSEIQSKALELLTNDKDAVTFNINWNKPDVEYDSYRRWIDYWKEIENEK